MTRKRIALLAVLVASAISIAPAAQATVSIHNLVPFTGASGSVQVTVNDALNAGFVTIMVDVIPNPNIGDLQGVFFNVMNNPGIAAGHVVGTDINAFATNTNNMGGGNNINPSGPRDIGLTIGTPGIGADDIQSTSFTVDDFAGSLTTSDFKDFAVRMTSVGVPGGPRTGSSKLGDGDCVDCTPPVPEPATLTLIGLGALGMGIARRRRRN